MMAQAEALAGPEMTAGAQLQMRGNQLMEVQRMTQLRLQTKMQPAVMGNLTWTLSG